MGEGTPAQRSQLSSPLPAGEGQGEGWNVKAANNRGRAYKLPPARDFAALTPPYKLPPAYAPREGDDRAAMPALVAKDFIEAVKELKGHALALTLVGRFLAEHHHGDIRAIHDLPDLAHLEPAAKERAPYRVMRAVEIALANRIAEMDASENPADVAAGRQLALLFFLGLFDRPAERELLPVVFSKAAAEIEPDPADIALAATDLIDIKRQIYELDQELRGGNAPEWRRQDLERKKKPLIAKSDTAVQAARRVLVRRLFGGMHAFASDEHKITDALSQLAKQGLVSRIDEKEAWKRAHIDCHPLVREYFGARLKELDGATFRAGHGRLYDHYRYAGLPDTFREPVAYGVLALKSAFEIDQYPAFKRGFLDGSLPAEVRSQMPTSIANLGPAELRQAFALVDSPNWMRVRAAFLPENEAGMAPLFAAIGHGCAAEREMECWSEVFLARVKRGKTNFAANKLGLHGQQLAALASFFETPFTLPSPRLSERRKGLLLNAAGYDLLTLGRLEDAADAIRSGSELQAEMGDMDNAAIGFSNLSELLANAGHLFGPGGALAEAERAMEFAKKAELRSSLLQAVLNFGPALLLSGALARAEFVLTDHHPGVTRLNIISSFRASPMLLARGRVAELLSLKKYVLSLYASAGNDNVLEVGRETLAHAQAALALVPLLQAAPSDCVAGSETALRLIRQARSDFDLPVGLLTYAEALWRSSNVNAAGEPLREAETIAARGPMPLFMVDAHLLRARIQLSEHRTARARRYRDAAAALIDAHGYGRAKPELAVLDAEIACAENAVGREAALAAAMTAIRGEPYRDERTGITIDGGWWGLFPRLEALLPDGHPGLASLRAARDAYNAERDAYLAAEDAKPAKGHGGSQAEIPDEMVRHIFADPQAQEMLRDVMRQNNLPGAPADLPFEVQRAIVAALVKQGIIKLGEAPKDEAPELPEVPDALLDQLLADPKARAAIQHRLTQAGIDEPFERMPRETQREAVAAMMAAMQETKHETEAPEAPDIPDAMVRHVFADPQAQELLREVMRQNDLPGAPADLPFEVQRAIAAALIEKGIIKYGEAPQDEPPPPPQAKAPPPPPEQPGNGKKGGGWWPWGRKH